MHVTSTPQKGSSRPTVNEGQCVNTWQKYRVCNIRPHPRSFTDARSSHNKHANGVLESNKTWQGYRLKNPRLRHFSDPIIDSHLHPETPVNAIAEDPVLTSNSSRSSASTAPSATIRRTRTSPIPLSTARYAAPICGAVAAVGAYAWFMSTQASPVSGRQSVETPIKGAASVVPLHSGIDSEDFSGRDSMYAWKLRFSTEREIDELEER